MDHIGREAELSVNGKTYKLSRCDREILQQFISWAEKELPNELLGMKEIILSYPKHLQEFMVKEAMEHARCKKNLDSPEVQALLKDPDGAMQMFYLLLKKNHPKLTKRDAENIYDECVIEHGIGYLGEKFSDTQGRLPPKENQEIENTLIEKGLLNKEETFQEATP